jgi:hypothetical protein
MYDIFTVYGALNSTELNDIKDSLVNNLPEGITLPPELKDVDVGEGLRQASDIFKQKCIENSGSDAAYEEASVIILTLLTKLPTNLYRHFNI